MDEQLIKKCRVCGDKALSFNFNGLCCESCKIFFRRNVLKYAEFKCFLGGNCPMDIITRKVCQLCRLNKCFSIGMRKEFIVTKEAKTSGNVFPTSTATSSSRSQSSSSLLTGKSVLLSELLQAICDVELRDEKANEEKVQDEEGEDQQTNNIYKKIKHYTNVIKEEESEEISLLNVHEHVDGKGGRRPRANILINQSNGSQLSSGILTGARSSYSYLQPYESHCLEVIKKVATIFHETTPPMKDVQIIGYATSLEQIFNNQEAHIQNMLAFTNSIGGFQSLTQQDQLIMFKAAFPEILLLRSAFFFNFEKNAFLTRLSQENALYIKLDMLYFGPNRDDAMRLHRRLAFKVKDAMEDDTTIRDLVSVLIMFMPRDSVTCPEYVRYQYFSYCHLLHKYLQFKYQNNRKATNKYIKLTQLVPDIGFINQKALNVVSQNVDPTKVSDVLAEIYLEKNQQPDQQLPLVNTPYSHSYDNCSNQHHQMAQQSKAFLHQQFSPSSTLFSTPVSIQLIEASTSDGSIQSKSTITQIQIPIDDG